MPRMNRSARIFALAAVLALLGSRVGATSDQGTAPEATSENGPRCTFCPKLSSPICTLCVEANPLLIADQNGAASGTVHVCNRTSEKMPIALSIGDFLATAPDASKKPFTYPLAASVRMTASDEASKVELARGTPLEAGHCAVVQLSVSGLSQPGLHSAELRNDRTLIGTIAAVRYLVPFNLKVDSATPDKAEVVVSRANPERAFIRIRNDDPMGYRFRWRIEMEDWSSEDVAWVGPHQYATIPVKLESNHFKFLESGFLTSGTRNGFVLLTHEPDPSLNVFPLPPKRYPVSARLQYFGELGQRAWNTVFILLFLLVGIGLSLLVNYVLPIQRKRVAIKQQLADLEGRLGGLGEVVDSRTLSLLRVEKKRLRDVLRELSPWFPSTEEGLPALESRIENLSKRIDLTVGAGDALLKLALEDELSEIEKRSIAERCRAVLQVVTHHSPSQKDMESAEDDLLTAKKEMDAAGQKPSTDLIAALVSRASRVRAPAAPIDPSDAICNALEGMLGDLHRQFPSQQYDPTREEFVRDAIAVRKAELLTRYFDIVTSSNDDKVRKPRLARGQDLFDALSPGPAESLHRAEKIVREAEQNVYKEDIRNDIASGKAQIEVDPPMPLPYQLVTFRITLPRPGSDVSEARKEFKCRWTVDGVPSDSDDWTLVTYFEPVTVPLGERTASLFSRQPPPAPRKIPVAVTIEDNGRATDVSSPGITLEGAKEYVRSRTWLSLGALGVTFLVVAIGLLTVAQEKLQSLDWMTGLIAIVALGFGADVLKKLIARP